MDHKAIDMEVSIHTGNHHKAQDDEEQRWLNVFVQNDTKRKILILAVKAYLESQPILVRKAKADLNITTTTMGRALDDLVEQGFVTTEYISDGPKAGFKDMMATEKSAEYYYKYSRWRFYYFKSSGMEDLAQTIVGLDKFAE